MQFTHLHCHSQYSLLDGAASISGMVKKAVANGMQAMALTDHGNMFGAFEFVKEAKKNNIKAIVGCEFYLVEDRHKKNFTKQEKDIRYHQLLLAKNQIGYQNISKLCSLGYIEGLYSKYPRIDKEILLQHKEGLIATSCCLGAEVPQTIIKKGEAAAEEVFKWWLDVFGDDYYIELQRHNIRNIRNQGISQEDINQILLQWSKKYNVPVIATNDSHYIDEADWTAHDILLCINTGEKKNTPIATDEDEDRKGTRFGFPNNQFYFKTKEEMLTLFQDIPQAIDNTQLIADKVETPNLKRDVLLPNYVLPEGFKSQGDYLRFLTFEGAKKRYGILTLEIEERLNFELDTIIHSGYPGYFLIVQDFTTVARNMGVWVGPGRGSAAGSAVAYCLGITNVDPIAYNLLFERFLNPERISMPDIDIDFDDEGREKVIDYVVNKYGQNQVAQIVTYGTMAARSSLRDVGRVLDIPISEVDAVVKSLPDGISLNDLFDENKYNKTKEKLNAEQKTKADSFKNLVKQETPISQMIHQAVKLEGSVRNTGVHACGIIITPEDITNIIPTAVSKDSSLLLTQFENSSVEDAGLLKMDFLGLKTLSEIKEGVRLVKQRFGIDINPDDIPLDDEKTYQLFQRGETNGIFQFESAGMQKWLRLLKPNKFDDLIAMNALFRPGPMEYIPNYINRKHGKEPIEYDLPIMEEILKETYGINVYQEQVMRLSQVMAGFTKGQADTLRKAMGKKDKATMDKLYDVFVEGCVKNNLDKKKVEKVWTDWEAFASYAFNKSHATCYAFLAFQTAYLKANYPAEFMAAVLTNKMSNIEDVNFLLTECKRLGIKILGPDINESDTKFSVNKDGAIRFALSALKGVGEAAVEELVAERKKNGPFASIFDLSKRVNLRTFNKKSFESIAKGGGFDCFKEMHRAQYLFEDQEGSFIEKCIRYGNKVNTQGADQSQSLFGDTVTLEIATPKVQLCEPWSLLEKLKFEEEVTGIYISGHPLDPYRKEIESFCTCKLSDVMQMEGKDLMLAGMVQKSNVAISKTGREYGRFTLQDYNGVFEFWLFGENCLKFKHFIGTVGTELCVKGRYQTSRDAGGNERKEFQVQDIFLLSELRNKFAKAYHIQVQAEDINAAMYEGLEQLCKEYPGNMILKMGVRDQQFSASLVSKRYKLSSDDAVINKLEELFGENFKLSK